MRTTAPRSPSRRRGFTIVELAISLCVFAALGWCMLVGIRVAGDSNDAVQRMATQARALRKSGALLTEELRTSSDATITVTALPDGNHQLRFQRPILSAGAAAWGVVDPLGTDDATRNLVGWSVQYTVRAVAQPGGVVRQLVRQVLDPALAVQREQVLASGLRSGADVPPGFTVVQAGAVWEITLSMVDDDSPGPGLSAVLHVRTRN